MKRSVYLLLALLLITPLASAQMPTTSTEDAPVWYHIQVIGEAERANLVFTAENAKVFGKTLILNGEEEIATQLWRFEKDGDNYSFINKGTGKKMNLGYDSSKSIRVGTLSDSPATSWKLIRNGDSYNIMATTNISQGNSSHIYAHQASNWDSRAYVIMFESSTYNTTDNSLFNFIEYNEQVIEESTDGNEVWYYISSACPEIPSPYITATVTISQESPKVNYKLYTFGSMEKERQRWKLVAKENASSGKSYHLMSAAGGMLPTVSYPHEHYNYLLWTDNKEEDNGWQLKYLGSGQYEIYGVQSDGVVRYLNASSGDSKYPALYEEGYSLHSTYAWRFEKADEKETDIPQIEVEDSFRAYANERYIVVEGCDDYTIRTIQGIPMRKDSPLLPGVYLVTGNNRTIKVLVR